MTLHWYLWLKCWRRSEPPSDTSRCHPTVKYFYLFAFTNFFKQARTHTPLLFFLQHKSTNWSSPSKSNARTLPSMWLSRKGNPHARRLRTRAPLASPELIQMYRLLPEHCLLVSLSWSHSPHYSFIEGISLVEDYNNCKRLQACVTLKSTLYYSILTLFLGETPSQFIGQT